MDNFDPCSVFLAIAANIPQQLKTGFVLQGHILFGFFLLNIKCAQLNVKYKDIYYIINIY